MLPDYPAGVAATSPPYPTPRGAIPWGHPARNSNCVWCPRNSVSPELCREKPLARGGASSRIDAVTWFPGPGLNMAKTAHRQYE